MLKKFSFLERSLEPCETYFAATFDKCVDKLSSEVKVVIILDFWF